MGLAPLVNDIVGTFHIATEVQNICFPSNQCSSIESNLSAAPLTRRTTKGPLDVDEYVMHRNRPFAVKMIDLAAL